MATPVQKFIASALGAALAVVLAFSFATRVSALDLDLTDESENGENNTNFDYLIANGEMHATDPLKLKKILDKRARKGRRTVVLFTSGGGFLDTATSMAEVIVKASDALYKKHGLSNLLVVTEECSSACAAFTATLTSKRDAKALEIYVSPDAQFGFHAPMMKVRGKLTEVKNQELRRFAIGRQLDILREDGVNPEWLEKNRAWFSNDKMTYVAGKQLCTERSLIVPADSCLPDGIDDTVTYIDSILADPTQALEIPNLSAAEKPIKSSDAARAPFNSFD